MKNNRILFILLEAVLGFLALTQMAAMFSSSARSKKVAVIVSNSEEDQWSMFSYGVKQAAADLNIDVVMTNTGEINNASDEKELIEEELSSGADAIIVQPSAGEDTRKMLEAYAGKTTILLTQRSASSSGEEALPTVKSDNYAMGKSLGEMILEDYSGSLRGKTIGIVNRSKQTEDTESREKGLTAALTNSGYEVLWTLYDLDQDDDPAQEISNQKKVDLVVALDTWSLEASGGCESTNKLHGALVYGIGESMKSVYYLDHENVRGLIIPGSFDMGYQSIQEIAEKLNTWTYTMQDRTIQYKVVRKDDLFTEENEKLLFSLDQ